MAKDLKQLVAHSLTEAAECAAQTAASADQIEIVAKIGGLLADAFRSGNKVMAAGNGGSMADAMHLCEELTGRFRKDRIPLPAIAFTDPTHLSCVSNDYGFEFIFSRLVDCYGKSGDVLVLLSTSGNSLNLIRAAESAKKLGVTVVGFLGKGGGKLLEICDVVFMAPGVASDRIQEIHMLCLHILCEAVESELDLA